MSHKHQQEFELYQKTQTIENPRPIVYIKKEGWDDFLPTLWVEWEVPNV